MTVPKSGSNSFGALISQFPNIIFLNTIFSRGYLPSHFNNHNRGIAAKTGVLTEAFSMMLGDENIARELVRLRTEKPIQWLMSFMGQNPGGYLGIKYHPWLDIWFLEDKTIKFALTPNIVEELVKKHDWQVITMARKNMIEQMASSLISIVSGYFGSDKEQRPTFFSSGKIDKETVCKYAQILKIYKMCYDTVINRSKQLNTIHIWYEDLIQNTIPIEVNKYFNATDLPVLTGSKVFDRKYEDAFVDWQHFVQTVESF
jgi:hypothetical protein